MENTRTRAIDMYERAVADGDIVVIPDIKGMYGVPSLVVGVVYNNKVYFRNGDKITYRELGGRKTSNRNQLLKLNGDIYPIELSDVFEYVNMKAMEHRK